MTLAQGHREQILSAFARHVAAHGYQQTNLSDIAAELGISKGTIGHHFGTKAEMLRELEEKHLTQVRREVELIWRRAESPSERIAALIYALVLYQQVDRDVAIVSQREIVQLADDPGMATTRGLRGELCRAMRAEIERGITAGVFRVVDAALTTVQIFGALQWMWTWFDPTGRHTPEQVGASCVDVFVGGLLTDRGDIAQLADPEGQLPMIVRECIAAVRHEVAA